MFRLKLLCVELVHLTYDEYQIRVKGSGWIASRKGNFVYCNCLNRAGQSTLKSRKKAVELCAWSPSKALEIHDRFHESNKSFLCTDMKNSIIAEIDKFVHECKTDNTKLPENPGFYQLFAELYPSTVRDGIVAIIKSQPKD